MIVFLLLLLAGPVWSAEPSRTCLADHSPASEECRRQAERERIEWALDVKPGGGFVLYEGFYCDEHNKNCRVIPQQSPCTAYVDEQTNQVVACVDPDVPTRFKAIKKIIVQHPCLAKMEAAMRAMQPFLAWMVRDPGTTDADADNPSWIDKLTQAYKLWTATKAQCWRESRQ